MVVERIGYISELLWMAARCFLSYRIIENSKQKKQKWIIGIIAAFLTIVLCLFECYLFYRGKHVYDFRIPIASALVFSALGIICSPKKSLEQCMSVIFYWEAMVFMDLFTQTFLFVFLGKTGRSFIRAFQYPGKYRALLLMGYTGVSLIFNRQIKFLFEKYVKTTFLSKWYGLLVCVVSGGLNLFFQRVYNDDVNLVTHTYLLVWLLVFLVPATWITAYYILNIINKRKSEEAILQLKINAFEKENQAVTEQLIQRRMLMHDMKTHLRVLYNLVENEDCKKAMDYMGELYPDMKKTDEVIFSGCDILDKVLNLKYEDAIEQKINCDFSCEDMNDLELTDIEICSLFGNLLDNAIEAQADIPEEKRYIKLVLKRKQKMLYIDIQNPYYHELLRVSDDLQTTKDNAEEHGLGTQVIKKIVQKHQGTQIIDTENQVFRCRIMMSVFRT